MKTPIYIFDLDGTLALTEHRQHILDNLLDNNRWDKFYAECINDEPNIPVIKTLRLLKNSGAEIVIWSGRSSQVYNETISWLVKHVSDPIPILRMRSRGDYTPDEILKKQWYNELSSEAKKNLVAIFADRNKVVRMWRNNNIPCFQIADGNF